MQLASRVPTSTRINHRAVRCRAAATAVKTPEKFIPPWRDCFGTLSKKGLRTVAPEEAQELLATGKWVLLDVRCVVEGCFIWMSGALWRGVMVSNPMSAAVEAACAPGGIPAHLLVGAWL